MVLFADDCVLYSPSKIYSMRAVRTLVQCSHENGLVMNTSKTKIMKSYAGGPGPKRDLF